MNAVNLKDDGIDLRVIDQCFGGNDEIYFKFLRRFFEDKDYINFNELMLQEKYSEAFNSAHALKGVAGNLGMIRVYEFLVVNVEKIRNANYEELDVLYIKFKNECDRLQEILG